MVRPACNPCERRISDDDRPDPQQMAIFRRMSAADRIGLAFRLREDAIRLRRACLRAEHPGESDALIESRVREWVSGVHR
jgi:hypothetical protein